MLGFTFLFLSIMFRSSLLMTGLLGGMLLATSPVQAANSLNVKTSVPRSCVFSVENVDFGTYDPVMNNKTQAIRLDLPITVKCNAGTTASINFSSGQNIRCGESPQARRMLNGSNSYLSYQLYFNTTLASCLSTYTLNSFTSSNTQQVLKTYVNLPAGQNPKIGNYLDNIVVMLVF